MYSAGEEFEKTNSEGDVEEYTCLSNITVGDKEYLVCDSETGEKKVFYYDSIEEELYDLDEDEEDQVLEIWNDEYYGSDKDYMYWNEDFGEYDKDENEDGEFNENNFDSLNENDENGFFNGEEAEKIYKEILCSYNIKYAFSVDFICCFSFTSCSCEETGGCRNFRK